MPLPVALQLYTVRDPLAKDPVGTLQAVADIGYRQVELAGFGDLGPQRFKDALDRYGIAAIGAHVGIDALAGDTGPLIEQARMFGYRYVTVSYLNDSHRTPEGYRQAAKAMSDAAGRLADQGLSVCYHNHAFEFDRLEDGSTGYDILTGQTSPAVGFELDIMWAVWGGQDPSQWLARLHGRVPLLHVKDTQGQGRQQFIEVGAGIVDLPAALAAAKAADCRHLVVEQDRFWVDDDPLKSAKVSHDHLAPLAARI
jgi:sugar phosphate isomerase/epimerase